MARRPRYATRAASCWRRNRSDNTLRKQKPAACMRPAFAFPVNSLIGRRQIFHDLRNIVRVDRRSVNLDHLVDFGGPEVLSELRATRLGLDVVRGMARRAVGLNHIEVRSRLELRRFLGELDGQRFGLQAAHNHHNSRGRTERGETGGNPEYAHDALPQATVTDVVSMTLRI